MSGEEDYLSPEARALRGPVITGTQVKKTGRTRYEVFLVFRPWQTCRKCQENSEMDLDEGDAVCPHTRKKEYEELLNRMRSGTKDAPIKLTHEQWVTKFNEVFISMTWEEPVSSAPLAAPPKKIPNL